MLACRDTKTDIKGGLKQCAQAPGGISHKQLPQYLLFLFIFHQFIVPISTLQISVNNLVDDHISQ